MLIAFDMDEILSLFVDSYMKYHNRVYGTTLKRDDVHTYSFHKILNIPLDENVKRVNAFYEQPEFFEIQPHPDCLEHMKKLGVLGHELIIITSRQLIGEDETRAWLDKHFPNMFSQLHMMDGHVKTERAGGKGALCEELGVDVFIEDSAANANSAKSVKKVFLLSYPWNRKAKLADNVERVNNWDELDAKLHEFLNRNA